MTPADFLDRLASIRQHSQNGQRAPHKPLLLLLALARWQHGTRELPFSSVEEPLRDLLVDFGRPTKTGTQSPQYPFWRLQSDGLWTVGQHDALERRASNTDPTVTSLRRVDPPGAFSPDVQALLAQHPGLVATAARALLSEHFPSTLHDEILTAAGFDEDTLDDEAQPFTYAASRRRPKRKRDPAFRRHVLSAYGDACALCGFDARLNGKPVGLDAAHVRWHQSGGADDVSNGLALCALHHRLFDRGAWTLTLEWSVEVAASATGGDATRSLLLDHHGRTLHRPSAQSGRVAEANVRWHHREVFRKAA